MADKIHRAGNHQGGVLFMYHCPGCNAGHGFVTPRWDWNGSYEKPTVSPSLLMNDGSPRRCHLFIRDGQLVFLGDCTHALAGKTVDMIDWET